MSHRIDVRKVVMVKSTKHYEKYRKLDATGLNQNS